MYCVELKFFLFTYMLSTFLLISDSINKAFIPLDYNVWLELVHVDIMQVHLVHLMV